MTRTNQINLETCYNYFVFLNTECERYLRDKKIEEEEIASLKIEFDRFVTLSMKSNLPAVLKSKIADLRLEYHHHERRDDINLIKQLIFGRLSEIRRSAKLKRAVEDFHFAIKGIPMFIKLNF